MVTIIPVVTPPYSSHASTTTAQNCHLFPSTLSVRPLQPAHQPPIFPRQFNIWYTRWKAQRKYNYIPSQESKQWETWATWAACQSPRFTQVIRGIRLSSRKHFISKMHFNEHLRHWIVSKVFGVFFFYQHVMFCQFKLGLNTSICWHVNLSFRLHEAICGGKKLFLCRWSCSVNFYEVTKERTWHENPAFRSCNAPQKKQSSCPAKAPLNLPERKTIVQTWPCGFLLR